MFMEVIQLHIIIVEDLEADRKKLMELIQYDFNKQNQTVEFSCYTNCDVFLKEYHTGICDALFLDIMMEGTSGIDAAKKVRENEPNIPIIFTTAEPNFALDGFSVHAMDYLMKPLSEYKVNWCLKQLQEYIATPRYISILEITGWGHSNIIQISLDNIVYAQYHNHTVEIHTLNSIHRTRLSFQDFMALLPQNGRFYICGRGLMVDFDKVERITNGIFIMKNQQNIAFSRNRNTEIQKAFAEWIFVRSRKGV